MSILIHRCECGHPDIFHGGTRDNSCEMACGCPRPDVAEQPEVLPTWDGLGNPVTTITKRGTRWSGITTCDCPQCKAQYDELNGVAA